MKFKKVGVVLDHKSHVASKAYNEILKRYGFAEVDENDNYDVILAIGGDGVMLRALHRFMKHTVPIYGMNRGSIGFLMNKYSLDDILAKLENAKETVIYPLEMTSTDVHGTVTVATAINEIALLRETNQAAHIQISINDRVELDKMVGDGILVASPAGSSAYNFAAYGPILPLNSKMLALTPLAPFRPRRWHGALLTHNSKISFEVLSPTKRPVGASADYVGCRNVKFIEIIERSDLPLTLLFDKEYTFEERLMREQFLT
ncbi:NAD kinase [Rickettsiales endosymbiont of Peranema trichophorum]|uniref:NAD kinase n=1 Tax=Rickettsiales endosymbiont of Peranema trichophorum TaxID=2486577 RepID=UPI0010237AB1|nr:NAD kinase [Rickettsiales endosymbiont of Peranema trichophorum]RZI47687.1 NAD kinase [Rickettsiales endosymbiont of Peranema trichophorum]